MNKNFVGIGLVFAVVGCGYVGNPNLVGDDVGSSSDGDSTSDSDSTSSTGSSDTDPNTESTSAASAQCGDGMLQRGEDCDLLNLNDATCETLGYAGGELNCNADCAFDESACVTAYCGNGIIDDGEQCDGEDLGGFSCVDLGYSSGTLVCGLMTCIYDASGCEAMADTSTTGMTDTDVEPMPYQACPNGVADCAPGEICVTGAAMMGQLPWTMCTSGECMSDDDCIVDANDLCTDLPGDGMPVTYCVPYRCDNDPCPAPMACAPPFSGVDVCVWPL